MFGGRAHIAIILSLVFGALVPSGASRVLAGAVQRIPSRGVNYSYLDYFRFAEQRLNDKVENTDIFASIRGVELERQYRPETESQFELISLSLPKDQVVIVQTGTKRPFDLAAKYPDLVTFLVHPASFQAFLPYLNSAVFERPLSATALGSYRSLLVWNPINRKDPFNIKISLDVEIGAARRMLSRGQIERAAVTSLILKQGDPFRFRNENIFIIDEPYSVYLKDFEYGFTYRDLPEIPKDNRLIPLFSLYANNNGRRASLLSAIVSRSLKNPINTLTEQLIRPLVSHYVFFAMTEGLVSEPHEQNVMVELNRNGLTGRFFYRDLAGFNVSEDFRTRIGKDLSFVPAEYKKSIHSERTDLVANFESYLLNSNFFAMSKAVRPVIPHEEVITVAKDIFLEEIGRHVGKPIRTMSQAREVWRHHKRRSQVRNQQDSICSKLALDHVSTQFGLQSGEL